MTTKRSRNWMNFSSERHGALYGHYQTVYDTVDALAAVAFIIGSALFFSEATQTTATWLFLAGSVFFAVRPLVHLARDMHLSRLPGAGDGQGEG